MPEIFRFGILINKVLLDKYDRLIKKRGYSSRSAEAFRDLIQQELMQEE